MQAGPTSGRNQCCEVLNTIQGLVRRVGLQIPDIGLDALWLLEYSLRDLLILINLLCDFMSEWAEAEWRTAEVRWLEERVQAADAYTEALCEVGVCIDELNDERESLTTWTEKAKVELNGSVDCIC